MKLFLCILTFVCWSSVEVIPKQFLKKIDKEILEVFQIQSYGKEIVQLDEASLVGLSPSFDPNFFFKITGEQGEDLGYFYFGNAPSKADTFDFLVIFDNDLIIKKIKILAYREDYGGEISSKRWLEQFSGYSRQDSLRYGSEIKAISGATISAQSMTHAVNELLKNISSLSLTTE